MALDVREDVDEGSAEGDPTVAVRPPRDLTYGVGRKRVDGDVGMRPWPATEVDDVLGRLLGAQPHLTVRLAVLPPRKRLRKRPPEDEPEVAGLDAPHVPQEA